MFQNLMTTGVVKPQQFPKQQVLTEVANLLNIAPHRILDIECWHYQLWINIDGVGSKFVSYRRLPLWIEAAKEAINNAKTQEELDSLASLLRGEIEFYRQYYAPMALDALRGAWKAHSEFLKAEAERLEPMRAHLESAYKWQQSWVNVLQYCQDIYSLQPLMNEIKRQSELFMNVDGVVESLEEEWSKRWRDLALVS